MGGAKHEAGSGDGVSYRAPKDPSHCAPMCTVLCDPNYPPPQYHPVHPRKRGGHSSALGLVLQSWRIDLSWEGTKGTFRASYLYAPSLPLRRLGGVGGPKAPFPEPGLLLGLHDGVQQSPTSTCSEEPVPLGSRAQGCGHAALGVPLLWHSSDPHPNGTIGSPRAHRDHHHPYCPVP